MKISEVLAGKAHHDVVSIGPDATVRDLLALLAQHNIGAVVVSADGTSLDGIVSERDVVRRLVGDDSLLDAPVSQIMTTSVRTAALSSGLDEVFAVMTEGRFRHLPVLDEEGSLVGVISIGDVVKSHIDQVSFERDQLENYLKSGTA